MNRLINILSDCHKIFLLSCAGIVFLTGCSVDNITNQNRSLSSEDITAIGGILGESLSDESSGVISGISDAIAEVSSQGISRNVDQDVQTDTTIISNFSYRFDAEAGIHTVSFIRNINVPSFTQNVTDTLRYFYTSADGEIIAEPVANRNRIENVDFTSFRVGTVKTLLRNSVFVRQDTFLISGMSSSTPTLQIDGVHRGSGTFESVTEDGVTIKRNYQLQINLLDIDIQKEVVQQNQSLSQGVTGTLTWEITIESPQNGSGSPRSIRGNIEMFGDGTALLRFNQFENLFQVNLDNGDVKEGDREFEGRVISVSVNQSTFGMVNGRTIQITDKTEFKSSSNITNLTDLDRLLRENNIIRAEGEGTLSGNTFTASEVKFEVNRHGNNKDRDISRREIDFESPVQSVNRANNTVRLRNRLVVAISDSTEIDDSGDFKNLEEVQLAVNRGNIVIAEGEGLASKTGPADIEATEIEFELNTEIQNSNTNTGERDDDSDSDSDDDNSDDT